MYFLTANLCFAQILPNILNNVSYTMDMIGTICFLEGKKIKLSFYEPEVKEPYWGSVATINPINYIKEGTYPANTFISTSFGHQITASGQSCPHEGTDFSGFQRNIITG
jgi:hypothetical protein